MSTLLPIVITALLLSLLYPAQKWSFKRASVLIAALTWGGLSFTIALALQSELVNTTGLALNDIRLGIAPIVEEILKASLLLLPFVRRRLSNPVSGLLYGFAIGLGFALTESLYFAGQTPEFAVAVGITRSFSTNLMHGAGTALIGLALTMSDRRWCAGALALAIGLHGLFNALNYHLSGEVRLIVLVGLGVVCAVGVQRLINSHYPRPMLQPAPVYPE